MKIYVSQFYTHVNENYPFSWKLQKTLSEKLTSCVLSCNRFAARFGSGFNMMFRINARSGIVEPELFGPTVFKRDRDVEYTIFLPFDPELVLTKNVLSDVIVTMLEAICGILDDLGVSVSLTSSDIRQLATTLAEDPQMIDQEGMAN